MKANPLTHLGYLIALCFTVISMPSPNVRAEAVTTTRVAAPTKDKAAMKEKIKERILQKFDANKNGILDPDEKEALRKAIQERRASGKGMGRKSQGATTLKSGVQRRHEGPSSSAITA